LIRNAVFRFRQNFRQIEGIGKARGWMLRAPFTFTLSLQRFAVATPIIREQK
jgi:hypothetical protein